MFTEKYERDGNNKSKQELIARRDSALMMAALAQHSPAGTFAVWQHLQASEPRETKPGLVARWVARLFARKPSVARQAPELAPLRDTKGHVVLMPRQPSPLSPSANDAGVPARRRA
jgi:hypothetical protein